MDYAKIGKRIKAVRDRYFEYPVVRAAYTALDDLRHLGFSGPDGEAQCALLDGETGSGKSRLFREYVRNNPPIREGKTERRPVVLAKTPSKFTANGFAAALAEPFGVEGITRPGDKLEGLTNRLKDLFAGCGVELLLVEEFQHAIDRSRKGGVIPYKAADWLKYLLDETGVRIAFNGTPAAERMFTENDQLYRRRRWRITLKPFKWADDVDRALFVGMLEGFEEDFAFSKKSGLHEPELAERLHAACDGYLGRLVQFLMPAAAEAMKEGAKRIERAHLAQAYEMMAGGARPNPFTVSVLSPTPVVDRSRRTSLHKRRRLDDAA